MATIVIRSRTKERISGTYCWEWSLHIFHRLLNGEIVATNKLIDKKKAQSIIERRGLVESIRTADGSIYDTPDGDFKRLFPYGVRTKGDIDAIEKTNRL